MKFLMGLGWKKIKCEIKNFLKKIYTTDKPDYLFFLTTSPFPLNSSPPLDENYLPYSPAFSILLKVFVSSCCCCSLNKYLVYYYKYIKYKKGPSGELFNCRVFFHFLYESDLIFSMIFNLKKLMHNSEKQRNSNSNTAIKLEK